jgi:hypothetical protein
MSAQLLQGMSHAEILSLYEITGVKITCKVNWFLLSGAATLQAVEETKLHGKNVILIRGKADKPGGILGFIAGFLKLYKGADTFESYIDVETHLPVQCMEYKRRKDGSKEVTEHMHFDRERRSARSLIDGRILNDVPPDIQDAISILADFLYRANTQKMVVGTTFKANMLAADKDVGMKVGEVIVEITDIETTEDGLIYTLTSTKLPDVVKYPVVLSVCLLDDGEKKLPVSGMGSVKLPVLGNIEIGATLGVEDANHESDNNSATE